MSRYAFFRTFSFAPDLGCAKNALFFLTCGFVPSENSVELSWIHAMLFLQAGQSKMISDPENLRLEIATFYDRFLSKTDDILYLSPYLDAYNTGTLYDVSDVTVCTVIALYLRKTIARHTRTVAFQGCRCHCAFKCRRTTTLTASCVSTWPWPITLAVFPITATRTRLTPSCSTRI